MMTVAVAGCVGATGGGLGRNRVQYSDYTML